MSLFGEQGLVVIDADSVPLKKLFSSIIRDELDEQASSSIVEKTSARLEKNYKVQVNPREINLFYLDEQLRARIVLDDHKNYKVLLFYLYNGHIVCYTRQTLFRIPDI